MRHSRGLQDIQLDLAWLTIGVYDGVHRGHQYILDQLTAGAHAEHAPAVVLTFEPHPAEVFSGPQQDFFLTSPEERIALLAERGVDEIITLPFSRQVAATPASDFMQELHDRLGLRHLFVGYDFALGRDREGDIPTLTALGEELGYQLRSFEAYQLEGEIISSTRIRELLHSGAVEQAASLLGRPYTISGEVVQGDGRGRNIGVPTANTAVPAARALPANGVYACLAQINGRDVAAVTNIGVRPTFNDTGPQRTVEAHLLDFDEYLYGQTLTLSFLARLRGEQKFSGVDALVAQIHRDIETARALF